MIEYLSVVNVLVDRVMVRNHVIPIGLADRLEEHVGTGEAAVVAHVKVAFGDHCRQSVGRFGHLQESVGRETLVVGIGYTMAALMGRHGRH